MKRIRCGVIGLGIQGSMYVRVLSENPKAELISVCDINGERAEKTGKQYAIKSYSAIDEMLAESNLDMVVVATPDPFHVEPTLKALKAGCHVAVEKPLACSVADCNVIIEATKKARKKINVSYMNRWKLPFITAKKIISDGEIGEVVTIHNRFNDGIDVPTVMLRSWVGQSSVAWFLMSHSTDLVRYFTGQEPKRVYATGIRGVLVKESIDTEDSIHAIVTYKNGMQVTYTSNWIMPRSMPLLYDLKFEIVGTKGALQLDCFDQMVHKFSREKYEHPFIMQQEINGKVVGMWAHMIDAFLNSLINDTDPPVTAYDGLQATKVVEAIHASIKTGSVVNIE